MKKSWSFIICIAIGVLGLISSLLGNNTDVDLFKAFLQLYMTVFFVITLIAGIFMLVLFIRNRGIEESNIHRIREDYISHIIFSILSVLVIILFVMNVYYMHIIGDTTLMVSRLILIAFFVIFLIRHLQGGKILRNELREAENHMRAYGYTRRPR